MKTSPKIVGNTSGKKNGKLASPLEWQCTFVSWLFSTGFFSSIIKSG